MRYFMKLDSTTKVLLAFGVGCLAVSCFQHHQEQRAARLAAVAAEREQARQVAEHAVRMESLPAWRQFRSDVGAGLFEKNCPAQADRIRAAKENILHLPMAVDGTDFARLPEAKRSAAEWAYAETTFNAVAYGKEKALAPVSVVPAAGPQTAKFVTKEVDGQKVTHEVTPKGLAPAVIMRMPQGGKRVGPEVLPLPLPPAGFCWNDLDPKKWEAESVPNVGTVYLWKGPGWPEGTTHPVDAHGR